MGKGSMGSDVVEMLSALDAEGAEHLVVGAHSFSAHGVPRATGDFDVRVRAMPGDAPRSSPRSVNSARRSST